MSVSSWVHLFALNFTIFKLLPPFPFFLFFFYSKTQSSRIVVHLITSDDEKATKIGVTLSIRTWVMKVTHQFVRRDMISTQRKRKIMIYSVNDFFFI